MCPPVAAPVVSGPTRSLYILLALLLSGFVPLLLPICRDRCIRRAQFPRSPLITNVGGCGGQSSGHAPPRRLVPDWCHPACVNLKPVESNLSLSFETAAPTTTLRDPGPPHLVAHCVVTHTHTLPHTSGSTLTWPYQVASSGPRSTRAETDRVSDAYGDAAVAIESLTYKLPCTIEKKRPPPRLIPITTVLAFVTWSPLSRVHGSSQAQGPPKRVDVAPSRALPTCFPDRCTPAVHRQYSGNFITHRLL